MSKRALVVEDDANIAELLRLYLGKDGFDVMIAADGGKAESSFDHASGQGRLADMQGHQEEVLGADHYAHREGRDRR